MQLLYHRGTQLDQHMKTFTLTVGEPHARVFSEPHTDDMVERNKNIFQSHTLMIWWNETKTISPLIWIDA